MKPTILAAIILKDSDPDYPDNYRVIVATKIKSNKPDWVSRQLTINGWPPDYFFETVAKNGRKNNLKEATTYFGNILKLKDYNESDFFS